MKVFKLLIKVIASIAFAMLILLFIFFGHRDIPLEQLKAKYAPPPSAFITIDNMAVHYRDEGDSQDTLPIVLIHGTGSSLHTFDQWTDGLKADYRIIRMDLPGFGLTGPFPDRDYSMEHYVDFLKKILSALGIKKCILGGNSLGGEIAWRFTLAHQDQVEKLVLIDAAGYPVTSSSEPIAFTLARTPLLNKLLTFLTPRPMAKASVQNVYHDKSRVTEALVDRYFELTLRAGNRQALVDRMKLKRDTATVYLIPTIKQPTLILWGAQDFLIPAQSAYRFQNDLPNDTMVILEYSGHVPMEENPEESLAILINFLEEK